VIPHSMAKVKLANFDFGVGEIDTSLDIVARFHLLSLSTRVNSILLVRVGERARSTVRFPFVIFDIYLAPPNLLTSPHSV